MTKTKLLAIAAVIILQAGDVLATNGALAASGVSEINPLMAWMQHQIGGFWWLAKLAVMVPVVICLLRMPTPPVVITAAFCLAVVVNNLLWAM